ncbi:hypothetical protein MPOCJGCO_3448 [Methylobacterium trifolii]|uniref:Uncharacterized protein n=1 Tax=Methylobacterium trifolii TaxID=1003092 RepID=A0ABQ4U3J0_9HYPH|nr:hypothetical protein MPOCJGCO_3448 [Methylobacterium trifolii]
MSIRRAHRYSYPIDRQQLSATVRIRRAVRACETCGQPHE